MAAVLLAAGVALTPAAAVAHTEAMFRTQMDFLCESWTAMTKIAAAQATSKNFKRGTLIFEDRFAGDTYERMKTKAEYACDAFIWQSLINILFPRDEKPGR